MKNESVKIFQKKKNAIIEKWIKAQAADDALREDLISNEEVRSQSEELLTSFINSLSDDNIDNGDSRDFENVVDILSSISLSRAKQGFSPRETAAYIYGLKDALLLTLSEELSNPEVLYKQTMAISRLMDNFA
ncbi:MAG: RsbRD N-terminal domain-containing protein, partial [Ferruginibacter sp.]|nr:RsbRD N-terminal domain-containing protein [Ferruginibacter sp.]